jgi:hypothetical protein
MQCDLETIEPALSAARVLLMEEHNVDVAGAHAALHAARDFLELQRESVPEEYNVETVLASAIATLPEGRLEMSAPRNVLCRGDREQVGAAVRAMIQSAMLEVESILIAHVVTDGDIPMLRLELDGPGAFRDEWLIDGYARMTVQTLEPCWTRATRGGRFDYAVPRGAVDLRLSGIRVIPEAAPPSDAVLGAVRAAEQLTRIMLGEASSDPIADRDAALRAIDLALREIDSDRPRHEPADVAKLLAEAVESQSPNLDRHAIQYSVESQTGVPPIAIHRTRLRSALENLLLHATEAFARGGSVSIILDYDAGARRVDVLADLEGTQYDRTCARLLPSIRRSIEEVHGGELSLTVHDTGVTASIAIPDPVGRKLDAWLPGFDSFSLRSRQMLRLLKSGGPTPPEEFLLEGILEEELERMLLSRLAVAPATNLAHDLTPQQSGLSGSSAERLEKALGQIRKGKPKKEICKPAYAGEVFWAFRIDERHRAAVGTGAMDDAALKLLCTGLLATPPDYINCLRALAQCCATNAVSEPQP